MRTLRAAALVLAVLTLGGCPGDEDEGDGGFTQADLAGDWRYSVLQSGPAVASGVTYGWIRGTIRIDAAGNVSFLSSENSFGSTTPPSVTVRLEVAPDGAVTAPVGPWTGYRGQLDRTRTLLVSTATVTGSTVRNFRIGQKVVPGTSWSASDLAGTWRYHDVGGGALVRWEHGTATVAADGALSRTGIVASDGAQADVPDAGTLAIDADGVVTTPGDPSWSGFLSADKSILVATHTAAANEYSLNVIVRSAAGFGQADLVGPWSFHVFANDAAGASWAHGRATIDASGLVTYSEWLDATGVTAPPDPPTLTVAGDGVVTQTSPPDFHGVVAPGKGLVVGTATYGDGECGIAAAVR